MPNRPSKFNRLHAALMIVCLCLGGVAPGISSALAAEPEWEEAITGIERLYDAYTSLEASNKLAKQQIQSLRKQNNEKLKSLQSQIRLIDKAKLDQLKLQADQIQTKHAPLLAEYTDLGKKASEARKRKDQKSALIYDLKRNRIKASVTHARQEIKSRKDALSAAKNQASAKSKAAKDALKGVTPLKQRITAENKQVSAYNKAKASSNQRYKAAVKEGDASSAAGELGGIVAVMTKIGASYSKIYEWEQDIADILESAETKLP